MKAEGWILLGALVVVALAGGSFLVDATTQNSDLITRIAEAIAQAEGFYIAGSVANRKNNPGNLETAGVIRTFDTADLGWSALYTQIGLMLSGGSAHYNPTMTINEVASIYADGQDDPVGAQNWANNVANYLGVSVWTRLSELT